MVKVTALLNGKSNGAYRGTVALTSTDAQATLPGPYKFTAADKGVHSFPVRLKTSGSRTVTATDVASSANTGSQSVTVSPGTATTFALSSLAAVTAGAPQSITLTARDAFNNVATGYRGTVHSTSSDSQAVLPANYTFTAADAGSHAFSVTLKTAGAQTVTLSDTATAALTATSTPATVAPASASSLTLGGLDDAAAGTGQSVAITARDPYGNVAKGYTGSVAFGSSDPQASLPSNYAFTSGDAGSRHFIVTLKSAGQQSVTVTDAANSLSSSQSVAVSGGPAVTLDMASDLTGGSFNGSEITTAGQTFNVTLTAIDAYGNRATGYTGTVKLTSSDGRGGGAGEVQFSLGDSGRITRSGVSFFTKKIYSDHASLTAVDTSNSRITAGLTFEVLPGPAVRYSPCAPALSKASGYQEADAPIGVNDELGLPFTALDEYGNDATNREPLIVLGSTLPRGYEATATVTTSDPQAANINGATFTGSPLFVGTPVDITLRTAGQQTVTITDPNNSSLTKTCSYTVVGPKAFTGTINVADPKTTGNTSVDLPASSYVPPNDSGLSFDLVSGPYVDDPVNGLNQLGTVEGLVDGTRPYFGWNLNPALPPPGTLTCNTDAPCVTGGPVRITYTIRDEYGNTSAGILTIAPWNAVVPSGNIVYGTGGYMIIAGTPIPLNTTLQGTVTNVNNAAGSATVKVGANQAVNVAIPSTGTAVTLGAPVSVRIEQPLVVGGSQPNCTPLPGEVCDVFSFATVTITPANPSNPGHEPALQTPVWDSCVLPADGGPCPSVSFSSGVPGLDPFPPTAFVGLPYLSCDTSCVPYKFKAFSSIDETGSFSASGVAGSSVVLPPGLSLSADGTLSGTPTHIGLYSFVVTVIGDTSGVRTSAIFSVSVFGP